MARDELVDPGFLNDSLKGLTFHDSPPPTIKARLDESPEERHVRVEEPDAKRSLPPAEVDPEGAITNFIENLLHPDHAETQPHLLAIGYELEALVSIYSPSAVRLSTTSRPPSWNGDHTTSHSRNPSSASTKNNYPDPATSAEDSVKRNSQSWLDALKDYNSGLTPTERIRYEVTIPAWEVGEELPGVDEKDLPTTIPEIRVLVSLPPTYPDSSPPQLQLLGRYLGNFPIDAGLFGDITRTYISSSGVAFIPGDVCVFEGLTHVQSLVRTWYADNLAVEVEGQKARETNKLSETNTAKAERPSPSRATFSYSKQDNDSTTPQTVKDAQHDVLPNFDIISSEPIIERRSTFVGHAVKVTDEREVPLVVHQLLEDKKIAKAHHPTIFAYRIVKDVGGAAGKIISSDHDDDGESQAGARLQHLLDILELENVLVVVTRWYGGTLLGADRFKYINQVARDALELGGFLDDREKGGKSKGKKK